MDLATPRPLCQKINRGYINLLLFFFIMYLPVVKGIRYALENLRTTFLPSTLLFISIVVSRTKSITPDSGKVQMVKPFDILPFILVFPFFLLVMISKLQNKEFRFVQYPSMLVLLILQYILFYLSLFFFFTIYYFIIEYALIHELVRAIVGVLSSISLFLLSFYAYLRLFLVHPSYIEHNSLKSAILKSWRITNGRLKMIFINFAVLSLLFVFFDTFSRISLWSRYVFLAYLFFPLLAYVETDLYTYLKKGT